MGGREGCVRVFIDKIGWRRRGEEEEKEDEATVEKEVETKTD